MIYSILSCRHYCLSRSPCSYGVLCRIRQILPVAAPWKVCRYTAWTKADRQTIAVAQHDGIGTCQGSRDGLTAAPLNALSERSVGLPLRFGKDTRLPLMLLTAGCRTTSYYYFDYDSDHFTPPASNNPLTWNPLGPRRALVDQALYHMQFLSVLFWKYLRPRVKKIRPTWLPTPESTRWNSQNLRNACLCILRTIQSMINDLQGSSPSTYIAQSSRIH